MELEISTLLSKLSIESNGSKCASDGSLPSPMSASSVGEANVLIAARAASIEAFNKKFENTFKFSPVSLDVKKSLIESLQQTQMVRQWSAQLGALVYQPF